MGLKRVRFDLPGFIRDPKYYDFLRNVTPEEFDKVLSKGGGITEDILTRKYEAKLKNYKEKYDEAIKRYESLDDEYNNLLLAAHHKYKPEKIKPVTQSRKHEATAKVIWSDWHVEEIVESKKVNGLNKYNPDIAKHRSEVCAVNTLKLVEKERKDVNIENIVIHLGGDFIGGWIHEELQQTNAMSPIDATIYATELLMNSLTHIVKNGKFKRIVCVCSYGNHGRTTHKMQVGNQAATNYEKIIYHTLKKHFGDSIEFIIEDSTITYFKIYHLMGRWFHGHQIKYGGGIGGLSVPLIKKIAFWDKAIKADFNNMGHYHTLCYFSNESTVNASLKGFDAYAQEIGANFEPPRQSFQLVDSVHGITIKAPIICE